MDVVTFHFLISMDLETRLVDVVTAYLYGSLDSDIYMKIPEGLKMRTLRLDIYTLLYYNDHYMV